MLPSVDLTEGDDALFLGGLRQFEELRVVDVLLHKHGPFDQLVAGTPDKDISLPDFDRDLVFATVLVGDLKSVKGALTRANVVQATGEGHVFEFFRTRSDLESQADRGRFGQKTIL